MSRVTDPWWNPEDLEWECNAMLVKCFGGPMDGAEYALSREEKSTNRKPDGLWFNGFDEHGRPVQHQYKDAGLIDGPGAVGVTMRYDYDGQVVDTGIEFETSDDPEPDQC